MATIKVSALTALPVANATFTYGITNGSTEGKVPIGGAAGLAGLLSPTFTGNPKAPTQSPGDSTQALATTAFVATSFAPLASPALTGTPTAPTAAVDTNTTQLATTAFVLAEIQAYAASPTIEPITEGGNTVLGPAGFLTDLYVFTMSGTLTAYTLSINDGNFDGEILEASFNHAILSLTMGGTNLSTAGLAQPTAITLNQNVRWSWDVASSKWVRFQ